MVVFAIVECTSLEYNTPSSLRGNHVINVHVSGESTIGGWSPFEMALALIQVERL